MKIKGDEYVRLHKILTNISNRDIWEYLKDGKSFDEIIDKVPDEFYNWVKTTREELMGRFNEIDTDYSRTYRTLLGINGIVNRKSFANYVSNYKYSFLLFAMFDNKDYKQMIWKIVYPEHSKPFKNEN
jgi:RNA ligase